MKIEVKLFGREAELLGRRSVMVHVDASPPTCSALRDAMIICYPQLAEAIRQARIAVNHEFVDQDAALGQGDEVALIGAVSGG